MTVPETSMRRIFRELATLPVEQVEKELRDLASERERLEARQRSLTSDLAQVQRELADLDLEDRVLASLAATMRDRQDDEASPSRAGTETTPAAAGVEPTQPDTSGAARSSAKEVPARPSIPRSEAILQIVTGHGSQGMTPADVRNALIEQGDTTADMNGIRVALRRWVRRERLVKVGRVYRAPEHNGGVLGKDTGESPSLLSSTTPAT